MISKAEIICLTAKTAIHIKADSVMQSTECIINVYLQTTIVSTGDEIDIEIFRARKESLHSKQINDPYRWYPWCNCMLLKLMISYKQEV